MKPSVAARTRWSVLLLSLLAIVLLCPAAASPQAPEVSVELSLVLSRVIGERVSDLVLPGDTLLDIAFRNRVGFEALSRLNPDVDTWIPVPGTVLQVPTQVILPQVKARGLVINIPEMRLFDFTVGDDPEIFPAAVGDPDDPTPTGDFQVGEKRSDPVWYVPKSMQEEKPGLPASIPAGPTNPLGSRWMRISETSYGIHGTNTRWSIGREATHGCVRLFESDIQKLFARTPEGTPLQIIYQPYKWGLDRSQILFEAHPDRYGHVSEPFVSALDPIRRLGLLDRVDIFRVQQAISESRGVPIVVGTLPPPL